jgi:hypothetical protein
MVFCFSLQIFAAPPNAGIDGAPLRTMVAYERLHVEVGETKTHTFDIQSHNFMHADIEGKRVTVPGPWRMWVGADGETNAVVVNMV